MFIKKQMKMKENEGSGNPLSTLLLLNVMKTSGLHWNGLIYDHKH